MAGTAWSARYDGPSDGSDEALAEATSPDGTTLFVTGSSTGSGTYPLDYATVAYDAASGTQRWAARYDAGSIDIPTAIAVSPDGAMVFVTGQSFSSVADFATVAYDAGTGAQVWVARYDDPSKSSDVPYAIAVSPDGRRVYVTGALIQTSATIAYDAESGTQLWLASDPAFSSDSDLAVSPDGATVFVIGTLDSQYHTVAYDAATGAPRWDATYEAHGERMVGAFVELSADGATLFVTGTAGDTFRTETLAYDADTGARRWVADLSQPGAIVIPAGMALSPDGGTLFVSAFTGGAAPAQYVTVAYDASTGETIWQTKYHSSVNVDVARALAVTPDGTTVFVTGYPLLDRSWHTVAYDATTGHQRGVATVTLGDTARALAVSPDGSELFVAGSTGEGESGSTDFGTVAYRLTG